MARLEREARDARVKETERRMQRGIYGQLPYQVFMIHAIKAPMLESIAALLSPESGNGNKLKALIALRKVIKNLDKFPEPTIENTWHPNSHRLIELRDEFFERYRRFPFRHLIQKGIKFGIIIYDYDRPYRDMGDWAKAELDKKGLGCLSEIRDEFFKHCVGLAPGRLNFMRQVFNLGIIVYRSPYKGMMDWAWERLKAMGWTPRGTMDLIGHEWEWWKE